MVMKKLLSILNSFPPQIYEILFWSSFIFILIIPFAGMFFYIIKKKSVVPYLSFLLTSFYLLSGILNFTMCYSIYDHIFDIYIYAFISRLFTCCFLFSSLFHCLNLKYLSNKWIILDIIFSFSWRVVLAPFCNTMSDYIERRMRAAFPILVLSLLFIPWIILKIFLYRKNCQLKKEKQNMADSK